MPPLPIRSVLTGALLITFRDGQPQVTGLIDEADETAEAMITDIMSAISEPTPVTRTKQLLDPALDERKLANRLKDLQDRQKSSRPASSWYCPFASASKPSTRDICS